MPDVFRSRAFKSGLAYAGLFTVSAVILFAVVYWQTAGYMQNQLHGVIDHETQTLVGAYHEGGLAGLKKAIGDRLESGNNDNHYLLAVHDRRLAGDLPARAAVVGWSRAYRSVQPGDTMADRPDDGRIPLVLRGTTLPDGAVLVVARDAQQLAALRARLVDAVLWGLVVVLLLGAAGGALMGRAALRRVERINRVAGRIIDGDLSQRVPDSGRGDEFDHLARHLNRMLDQIERLMDSMRQVSSDIAHDLRTPLGRLRQGLDTAREQAQSPGDYRPAVDRAIAQTDQILETFSALLRIAQIESGSRRARFARVELSALVETLAETYAVVAEETAHVFSGDIQPGVAVRGDRELVTQALANLIENALTHTPPGTRIEMTLRTRDGAAVVSVADNGPGIPADARTKVTQRFYRLEASRTRPGNGLGLSMVAAVADLHEATLTLDDNAPGLIVSLRLPIVG
ncbi:sensor histidine kinase [Salinisphaera hydrothermalis]|uniref:histidine kinase n=1 Tax=Salinisphaera hydrothermalis (strain C41B8) TaxID=1304275 RepID=A0A084IN99_SALHC|nr:HAMP domain-containing sensor histidine kinase [Salinisphaera hydrothermalis]KEZ78183.1 integral membrane sensor signal transduction histidine kinase [Salinisphaera hydrothermalis C41B8]